MAMQSIPPIAAGYAYCVQLEVIGPEPAFPAGCALRAQIRPFIGAEDLAGTLTTSDGTIVRLDEKTIELRFPAALTDAINASKAVLDLARVDLCPPAWIGVQVEFPVVTPVTRPQDGA